MKQPIIIIILLVLWTFDSVKNPLEVHAQQSSVQREMQEVNRELHYLRVENTAVNQNPTNGSFRQEQDSQEDPFQFHQSYFFVADLMENTFQPSDYLPITQHQLFQYASEYENMDVAFPGYFLKMIKPFTEGFDYQRHFCMAVCDPQYRAFRLAIYLKRWNKYRSFLSGLMPGEPLIIYGKFLAFGGDYVIIVHGIEVSKTTGPPPKQLERLTYYSFPNPSLVSQPDQSFRHRMEALENRDPYYDAIPYGQTEEEPIPIRMLGTLARHFIGRKLFVAAYYKGIIPSNMPQFPDSSYARLVLMDKEQNEYPFIAVVSRNPTMDINLKNLEAGERLLLATSFDLVNERFVMHISAIKVVADDDLFFPLGPMKITPFDSETD